MAAHARSCFAMALFIISMETALAGLGIIPFSLEADCLIGTTSSTPSSRRIKVKMLSVMAGEFLKPGEKGLHNGRPEWNVKVDIPSARIVMQEWPTLMVVCPYKLGKQLLYPGSSIEKDFDYGAPHPIVCAWKHYIQMPYDRPSWDLVSALYPVRSNRGYFNESPLGTITVDEKGITKFIQNPKGNTIILSATPKQQSRIVEAFTQLASSPPASE